MALARAGVEFVAKVTKGCARIVTNALSIERLPGAVRNPLMTVVISPCAHPQCRDEDGNRRLTTQNMCDACQARLRRELRWLVEDYVTLKTFLPSPVRRTGGQGRHTQQTSFGHPAQDASDACREIAWALNRIEAGLRHHVGDLPAPALETTAGLAAEDELLNHAYTYLRGHFEQLVDWPDVGYHAAAVHDTHQTNRNRYGLTRHIERLPLPCPSCDVAQLVRDIGKIVCKNCGREIREEDFPMLERIAIKWKIDEYESEKRDAALSRIGGLIHALAGLRSRQNDQNVPT